jgi:hypothetical protein
MYLDQTADAIREHIPSHRIPSDDSVNLLRLYAVLLRAKGSRTTQSDVHDVWAAWISTKDPDHRSLVPYEALDEATKHQDSVYARAIRIAAAKVGNENGSQAATNEVLFPSGPPREAADVQQLIELYKVMVGSSESLVSRRQGVNTFFLTMNGVLLTGFGLLIQNSGSNIIAALAIATLSLAGAILCGAWRSLIVSFGQLNRGKFKVISAIEQYLTAAIYAAEWEALGRGEDPKVYRSFTSREIWVPNALFALHFAVLVVSLLIYVGVIVLH